MKTISLKKVSAVAVASLGFGLLSVVPAQAAAGDVSSSAILKSASSGVVLKSTTLVSSASTTVTAGAASFTDTATDAGKSIWTNEGFIGTIATVTSTTVAVLAAASPTQAAAATAFYMGTLASTTTADGIVTGQISGMTMAVGAAGAINIKLKAFTVAAGTSASARVKIGSNVISGAVTTQTITDTAMIVPITAPTTAGTYTAVVSYSNAGTFLNTAADQLDTTFTLTVTAASAYSNSLSQAFIVQGNAGTIATSTTDLLPVAVSKTAVAANAGKITINITTANQNHRLEIDSDRNAMKAQAVLLELEKYITLAQLSS